MSSNKYIVGSGPLLAWALAAWAEAAPDERLHAVDIGQDRDYRFDLGALEGVAIGQATAFVAWGPQFLNFRRLELMGELKGRGFRLPPLVCRGALIAAGVAIGENCAVGAGAVIGAGSKIGFNTVIGAGCILGAGVQVGASAWIADGVQVGAAATIGANATLGRGVILADGVSVGKQCTVDRPGYYRMAVATGSHILSEFSEPVVVLNA